MTCKKDYRGTETERLLKYISKDIDTGCWNWIGGRYPDGYGMMKAFYKTRQAHRVSYELFRGPIPDKMLVCHHCDNPSCVNPEHLFLGTSSDNRADSVRKKRHQYGETSSSAKLNFSQVLAIRKLLANQTYSQAEIARRFGVGAMIVLRLKKGRTWVLAIRDAEQALAQKAA